MSIFFSNTKEVGLYFRNEKDVMQAVQGPDYDYDDMSYQEKKSYLESDKKTWAHRNYKVIILGDLP